MKVKSAASINRLAKREASPAYLAALNLKALLAVAILETDLKMARKTLRGVVKRGTGEVEEIPEGEYDEFLQYMAKKATKADDTAMATGGSMLTKEQHVARLLEQKVEKEAQVAKSAACKQQRADRAEQKIIDDHKKEESAATKMKEEEMVTELIKRLGFWTSNTAFIKGADLKNLIKKNTKLLKGIDGYGSSLKKPDAFDFIQSVLDSDEQIWESA